MLNSIWKRYRESEGRGGGESDQCTCIMYSITLSIHVTQPPAECTFCTLRASHLTNSSLASHWIVIPTLGTGRWQGEVYPSAGLLSSHPTVRPGGTARERGRWCPSDAARQTTIHAAYHNVGNSGLSIEVAGTSDFNVSRLWVIPVWWRRSHIAHCLCKIMVSAKLLYCRKNVWCWLLHGCADQHGSFVKRLWSNQRHN